MAEYVSIVDPNGNGADYTSLANWVAGEQGLYTAADTAKALCRRTGPLKDTSQVYITGFTAVPVVDVDTAYRHEGRVADTRSDTGNYVYWLSVSSTAYVLRARGEDCTIRGLAVEMLGSGTYWADAIQAYAINKLTILSCLVYTNANKNSTSTAKAIALQADNSSQTRFVANCVVVGHTNAGGGAIGIHSNYGTCHIHNCTAHADKPYSLNAASTLKNSVAWGVVAGFAGSASAASTNNASNFGDAPGSNPLDLSAYAAAQVFTDLAGGDLSLVSGSPLIDAGADLSADPNLPVTDDCLGTARPQGAGYDIGAFEFVAGGGPSTGSTAAAWAILAAQQRATAHRILAAASQSADWAILTADADQTAWRVLGATDLATGWRVLADAHADAAWEILTAEGQATAWQILQAGQAAQDTAWRILTAQTRDAAWEIATRAARASAWAILTRATADTAWQILAAGMGSQALAWRVLTDAAREAGWRILDAGTMDTAWADLTAEQQATAWAALTEASGVTGWRILASGAGATAWTVLTVDDRATSWAILQAVAAQPTEWMIFAEDDLATAWRVLSDQVPSAVKVFLAKRRTFAYHAKTRTFVFLAKHQ